MSSIPTRFRSTRESGPAHKGRRIIAFDGSQVLTEGNNVLGDVADRLSNRRVALHALLAEDPNEPRKRLGIRVRPAEVDEARKQLSAALLEKPDVAVKTCGHEDYKWYVGRYSDWLAQQGATDEASQVQDALYKTMSTRQVRGHPVLDRVLNEIKERRDSYKTRRR